MYICLQRCQILTDFNNVCSAEPEKCTKHGVHLLIYYEDVDQLRERLISVWCELDQSVVDHAIDEWRRRLSACVDAEGEHSEHYL